MRDRIVIATHHKTGSQWMGKTFQAIGDTLGIPIARFTKTSQVVPEPPCVVLDAHSLWFDVHPFDTTTRVLHVVRDPRDVVISAMHYHRKSSEPWLHEPRHRFLGKTYQEKINSLADDDARYCFEMDNSAANAIGRMRRWSYARPTCFEARYEDLAGESGIEVFGKAIRHLGFSEAELPTCLKLFRAESIFLDGNASNNDHVRSGATRQWRQTFDAKLSRLFVEKFGDVLQRLGYAEDASWICNADRDRSD